MAQFFYKVKTDPTTIKEGFIDAESRIQAISLLEKQGFFPLLVEKREAGTASFSFRMGIQRINTRTVCIFTRQLASLLESGLTLISGMNILEKQAQNKSFKLVINSLIDDLKDGKAFSQSLEKYPKVFSPLYVALIRSAEASGMIDKALTRLADFMEKQLDLKTKVQTSLAYPLFILGVGFLTVIVLINFVIPKLLAVFTEFSQALPIPTQILIGITNFLKQYGWILFLCAAIFVMGFLRLRRNPEVRLIMDRFKLNIFLLKDFEIKNEIGSFCRSLSILIANGVELINSLEITEEIVTNYYLRSKIRQIREKAKEGVSLTQAIKYLEFMPAFVVSIITVGEETGNLEKSLERVSLTYEQELECIVKTFVDLLGPVMILIVGLIIGFIVVAMLLPIFQLNIVAG